MHGKIREYQFLFEELVKRDFKKKYKRTVLGMGWSMLMPLLMLLIFNVVVQLVMYGSAIFYQVDKMSPAIQRVFAFNPVYRHIAYVCEVVLNGAIPPLMTHLTLAGFAFVALPIGAFMYKRYNTRFLYYV